MSRNTPFAPFLPLLICLGVFLCGPVRPAGADGMTFAAANAEGRGSLSFPSAPLQTMTAMPFTLEVFDSSGARIAGADASCELSMPAMRMPENSPRIASVGDIYRGEAIFTMAGAWRMTCRIAPVSGPVTALTFDIPEVRLK